MRIFNIRLGHACNSSSTHSIVPLSALSAAGHIAQDSSNGDGYGWDHFMLASPEEKMRYLAATLSGRMPNDQIAQLTGDPGKPVSEDDFWGPWGYVDHQSLMLPPVEGPHTQLFLKDLADYLRRDDVVILGGNDNEDEDYWGVEGHLPFGTESAFKVRPGQLPDGGRYWTLMGRRSGDRIRFSFAGQPLDGTYRPDGRASNPEVAFTREGPELPYGSAPELVDMKVTGYCPFAADCRWCYMDSDRTGQHMELDAALAWLQAFSDAGVFEIALGGGEPTLWPHLPAFIAAARAHEININLTTKNLTWLAKPGALNGLSAVAVSINNRRDLNRFAKLDLAQIAFGQDGQATEITVQCVPAFCDEALLRDIIACARERNLRVTFLGVKRTGRAENELRSDDARWLEIIASQPEWWLARSVAVDTLMAAACAGEFEKLGISRTWYETTEGRFSCYVDGTTGTLAASSYTDRAQVIPTEPTQFIASFYECQRRAGLRQA